MAFLQMQRFFFGGGGAGEGAGRGGKVEKENEERATDAKAIQTLSHSQTSEIVPQFG